MSEDQSWRSKVLIFSGLVGAVLGIAAGLLYVRVAEESGGPQKVSTGSAIKLGMAALAIVRQASQLGG